MILIIYKQNGKITSVQHVKGTSNLENLLKSAKDFNEHQDVKEIGKTAEVKEFDENSLEAYLYNEQKLRKENFRVDLRDMQFVEVSLQKKTEKKVGDFQEVAKKL